MSPRPAAGTPGGRPAWRLWQEWTSAWISADPALIQRGRPQVSTVPHVASPQRTTARAVIYHDLHPPDEVRQFRMPWAGVLRFDEQVFVAQVRYGEVVLRHYAFSGHWFKVNCTTDLNGRFVETTASGDAPPFTFNCDIATPMLRRAGAVYAVDLCLDVLVRDDGRSYGVHDQAEFDAAIERGWLSRREADGARAGLQELTAMIDTGSLVPFLSRACPFGRTPAPEALPLQRVPVTDIPALQAGLRPSW